MPALADMASANLAYANSRYREAYPAYLAEAQLGNRLALNITGAMELRGLGTDVSAQKAAQHFRAAAEAGNPVAMANLAWMYQEGVGMPVDLKVAAGWYDKAAGLGNEVGRIMRPILQSLIEQNTKAVDAGIADSVLVGSPAGRCDPAVRALLEAAETRLPPPVVFTGSPEYFFEGPGALHRKLSAGSRYPDLLVDLASEYASAGCFRAAGRLLDRLREDDPVRLRKTKGKVIEALARAGHYDPAIALVYSGWPTGNPDENGQLYTLIQATALAGDISNSVRFARVLGGRDGKRAPDAIGWALIRMADLREDRLFVRFFNASKAYQQHGVFSNTGLAMAEHRLGNAALALQALATAEAMAAGESAAQNDQGDGLSSTSTTIAGAQAALAPERVLKTVAAISSPNPEHRVNALLRALRLSSDRNWQLRWLEEVDTLAPTVEQWQRKSKDGDAAGNYALCQATLEYARLGLYERAYKLGKERRCNGRQSGDLVAGNLREVFRFAAFRNEMPAVLSMLPGESEMRQAEASTHYLFYVVYGLVRAGQHERALHYLRLATQTRPQFWKNPEVFAAIGAAADAGFPFETWLREMLEHEKETGISRWDTLRVLFSACARVRGIEAAKKMAATLKDDDLATAQIGIAQGVRGFQLDRGSDIVPRVFEPKVP